MDKFQEEMKRMGIFIPEQWVKDVYTLESLLNSNPLKYSRQLLHPLHKYDGLVYPQFFRPTDFSNQFPLLKKRFENIEIPV